MTINPDDLRELADFLETRPVLAEELQINVFHYEWDKEGWQRLLSELGTFDKSATDYYLNATKTFGDLEIVLHVSKNETCERVVVGQRQVEKEVYPESVVPAIVTVTEDIVEWRCPETWKDRDAERSFDVV